jgi:hypothetical protein
MRKRLNARMEKGLEKIKNDYPEFKISNHTQLARLLHPDEFPVVKKDRVYADMVKGIIGELNDIEVVLPRLPKKSQKKILASDQYNRTLRVFLDNTEKLQKIKGDNFDKMSNSIIYQDLFNLGLEGLIKTMPPEFREILISQIRPTLQLMLSITKNYNKISKNKIPEPQFPILVTVSKLNDTT